MSLGLTKSLNNVEKKMKRKSFALPIGRIIEANPARILTSLQNTFIGEICNVSSKNSNYFLQAQTISIKDGNAILAPLGDIEGMPSDAQVLPTGQPFKLHVGDALLGRVLDGLGQPLDGEPLNEEILEQRLITPETISPMDRPVIDEKFNTGIKSIDAMATLGLGQRISVLGDAGAGKSTILAMLARQAKVDVVVLVSVGERGREIREMLDRQLPPEVRKNCIVVASTSEKPAMERLMASHLGLSIAEYFRDKSKNVLLLFDSVTRFARAQREVSLAAGEAAIRRGYTASLYAELPRLIERCGKTNKGSITAIFTVLTEAEGIGDPIAEELTSLTDGHIILSSKLGQKGHFPAIDVLGSRSRLMSELIDDEHLKAANKMRSLMTKYNEIELLVQVGEYAKGTDPEADEAISKHNEMMEFLQQQPYDICGLDDSVLKMQEIMFK